jgi:hypothetical protein
VRFISTLWTESNDEGDMAWRQYASVVLALGYRFAADDQFARG